MEHIPLLSDEYLIAHWHDELEAYVAERDAAVLQTLREWSQRDPSLTERQLDGLFVSKFFQQLWNYWGTGTPGPDPGYTLTSQFAVPGAGQQGGTGAADLALAHFGHPERPPVPQVLCEFKDINAGLDTPQRRKGNTRSPVQQCLDYLKHSFDRTPIDSTLFPAWGIVTDMNEFRLYFRKRGNSEYLRFQIESREADSSLLGSGENAQRQRFLFSKVFSRELLLAPYGKSALEKLLEGQWTHEKILEQNFYREYQAYRQFVYTTIVEANPNFGGTPGELVKLTQRFLDRCIFLLFCDDMGQALDFPPNLLRDMLKSESLSPTFSGSFTNIWSIVKELFNTMRDGGWFPPDDRTHEINRFNGGLFESLESLENLKIPNRVFCAKGQGESTEKLNEARNSLLYLAATYNFGAHGKSSERTITLYALGRIFEQSITDLEYMHAEAEGVPTIATVTKRKRDGVYYTPERITSYIAQETIGARLADERERLGLVLGTQIPDEDTKAYRAYIGRKVRRKTDKLPDNAATRYLALIEQYLEFVKQIKILDPACGSGAFLIQALQFLNQHYRDLAAEQARIGGAELLFDQDAVIRDILRTNLYGVDINPESVEITQLALWLNTATPDKPLSTLDRHIRCGNSLVGSDFKQFYQNRHHSLFDSLDGSIREKVNVFDWETSFPEVFGKDVPEEKRGFDCVIGNPPYVKLQNFRKVKPDESDYYLTRRRPDGSQMYASAQTGNFDLYLLFIEKGVSLLNAKGRMGYIAPSLWLRSEYGEGLREWIRSRQALDRWIDFKSFQVFEEATTYTAIQFYAASPRDQVRFQLARDGDIAPINWAQPGGVVPLSELPEKDPWILLYERERTLFAKLRQSGARLDDGRWTTQIFQGLITSADWIYHLERVGPCQYRQLGRRSDGIVHPIEDAIMRPLVSGQEAKRYEVPETSTYLLFPYIVSDTGATLCVEHEMQSRFPEAWKYLARYESQLRQRESNSFDDSQWYRFGRNQSLDRHDSCKIIVPRLVENLACIMDEQHHFYLDNVDVGGIIPESPKDTAYLTGVLNSPAANFVFQCISKPFRGDYLSANKQYIAPIPIPDATAAQKKAVGEKAKSLQSLHTRRRDLVKKLQERIDSPQCRDDCRRIDWLWEDLSVASMRTLAPGNLPAREETAWARQASQRRVAERLERIDAVLRPGARLEAAAFDDELRLALFGSKIIQRFGLAVDDARYLAALWRQILRGINVTAAFTAERLVKKLLDLRTTSDAGMRSTIIDLDASILALDAEIAGAERDINHLIYGLYKLTDEEIAIVEGYKSA